MSDQQTPPQAPPQYSADGRWWWDGSQWVPARPAAHAAKAGWSGTKIVLVIVAASVAVMVIGMAALFVVTAQPIGKQVEMDRQVESEYCQYFPEDC